MTVSEYVEKMFGLTAEVEKTEENCVIKNFKLCIRNEFK
jgi:uncharacterized protein YkvS